MCRRLLLAAWLLLALSGCRRPHTVAPPKAVKLPNGMQIKSLGVVKVNTDTDDPGLLLKYETKLPFTDRAALRREAEAIWRYYRYDAEKHRMTTAIISPRPAPGIMLPPGQELYFTYKKTGDVWRAVKG